MSSYARWAVTAGSASGGRRSTAARAAPRSSSTCSSTRRTPPACRCRSSRSTRSGRRSWPTAPTSRRATSSRGSSPASCTSRSGTPSPAPGPTSRRCAPGRSATATSTSSTGTKVFTTGGHDADWVWLACRTDPDAPKHKGISIILVPTNVAGFKHSPIWLLGGGHTNATFYEDVRVPVSNVVAGENLGWKLITNQLNHERVALGPAGRIDRHLRTVLALVEGHHARRRHATDRPRVGAALARARARGRRGAQARELARRRRPQRRSLNPADASAMKVLGTEQQWRCLDLLLEIVGQLGTSPRIARRLGRLARARAGVPRRAGRHVRWRRERGPARDHRDGRPRPAPRAPVGSGVGTGTVGFVPASSMEDRAADVATGTRSVTLELLRPGAGALRRRRAGPRPGAASCTQWLRWASPRSGPGARPTPAARRA